MSQSLISDEQFGSTDVKSCSKLRYNFVYEELNFMGLYKHAAERFYEFLERDV